MATANGRKRDESEPEVDAPSHSSSQALVSLEELLRDMGDDESLGQVRRAAQPKARRTEHHGAPVCVASRRREHVSANGHRAQRASPVEAPPPAQAPPPARARAPLPAPAQAAPPAQALTSAWRRTTVVVDGVPLDEAALEQQIVMCEGRLERLKAARAHCRN